MIRAALNRLTAAGVPFATRGAQPVDDPPPGGDVDILVGRAHAGAAEHAIEAAGLRRLRAAGHPGHRFYVGFDGGRWLKLDVNLVPERLGWDLRARDAHNLARFAAYRLPRRRLHVALARRRPLALRRRGPVIALLGPDGAGKGSVIAGLEATIPVAVTPRYLGERPRTRPWALRAAAGALPDGPRRLQFRLRMLARAAARAWVAHAPAWRGDIVLCDRHPLEAIALDAGPHGLGRMLARGALGRLVPRPDAIVLLDAPGDVLFARKGEHSPERLEQWRRRYREAFADAAVVDSTGGLERAVAATSAVVWRALAARRGW